MIKTYRGQLTDTSPGNQNRIRLSTIKGKVGYRIFKLQIMHDEPGQQHAEHTVKIYKTEQTTINNNVNFTDSDLLAAAYLADNPDQAYPVSTIIVFDREVFNQDIYITAEDTVPSAATPINYYLELEVIPLDDAGAEYTTLKDIRQKGTP